MISNADHLSWPAHAQLQDALHAGSVIAASDGKGDAAPSEDLSNVLSERLAKFDSILDSQHAPRSRSYDLDSLKLSTAFASLFVLQIVDKTLKEHETSDDVEEPFLGTRDLAQLRTHTSLVFQWGADLLLQRILPTLPKKPSKAHIPPGAQIIDLTAAHENLELLARMLFTLLRICRHSTKEGAVSSNAIAKMVLLRELSPLLRCCLCVGWLPKGLRAQLTEADVIMHDTIWLLDVVSPSQCIIALGPLLAKGSSLPPYASRLAARMLTTQLGRPSGIAALLSSILGEDKTSSDAPLEKLEAIAKVLSTVPRSLVAEEFFKVVIQRLLYLLSPKMKNETPISHKRAAAFSLSRILLLDSADAGRDILIEAFAESFRIRHIDTIEASDNQDKTANGDLAFATSTITPTDAIHILSVLISNADPTPTLIQLLLQPIAPHLYHLFEYLQASRVADPMLKEAVEGLLATWGRLSEANDVVDGLWAVVEGQSFEWGVDYEGDLAVLEREDRAPSLTLAQLADLQEGKLDSTTSEDANPLSLRPNPAVLANFVKRINRNDVSSILYDRIFDENTKVGHDADPLRKLTLLQLLMHISQQNANSEGLSTAASTKLSDVTQKLSMIKLSLDYADPSTQQHKTGSNSILESLRIIPDTDEAEDDGADSDDEDLAPGLEGVNASEHMTVTAVNLLLALLEEYPELSPRNAPLLNEIYSQLEPLTQNGSEALRPRAREARVTLTARLASEHSSQTSSQKKVAGGEGEEDPQKKYQRALKLLQDPLLPVRAHGLLLLRELVAPAKVISKPRKNAADRDPSGARVTTVQGASISPPSVPHALIPAIRSIFLQSLEDEDSYIFLHAVQGLSAMVDGFGVEVLRGLVDAYASGLGAAEVGGEMARLELDRRVRIGEALDQVVRRCGKVLGKYVDIIVPHVFTLVRSAHLPTTLRTSAISVLAAAVDTDALALSAYSDDLVGAMVDLVQVESAGAIAKVQPVQPQTETRPKIASGTKSSATSGQERGGSAMRSRQGGRYTITSRAAKERGRSGPWGDAGTAASALTDVSGVPESDVNNAKSKSLQKEKEETMDERPTSTNSRFPPLRRAAIHFISLLLKAQVQAIYENEEVGEGVRDATLGRVGVVLGYVSHADGDVVVRVMAREATELAAQLQEARLRLPSQ